MGPPGRAGGRSWTGARSRSCARSGATASGTTALLRAVWGAGRRDAFAVGDRGTIVVSDDGGMTWTTQPSGVTAALRAVWGSDASDVYAAGDRGTLLRLQGGTWAKV